MSRNESSTQQNGPKQFHELFSYRAADNVDLGDKGNDHRGDTVL